MPDSVEENPARTGAQLPVGESAQATNDLRDRTILFIVLAAIAVTVAAVWFTSH